VNGFSKASDCLVCPYGPWRTLPRRSLCRRGTAVVAPFTGLCRPRKRVPNGFRTGPHVGEPAQEMARPSSPEEVRRIEVFGW